MDIMRDIPDKYFELAIVDPPYGCGCIEGHENIDWNSAPPDNKYFEELYRISENTIIWGCNNYVGNIKDIGRIVWNKLGPNIGRRNMTYRHSHCELASQSIDKTIKMFSYTWIGNVRGNDYRVQWDKKTLHPCEKPIELYRWLLLNYAKPGDKIIDTHSGSGSCAIACHLEKHDFLAIEKDPDYHRASVARLDEVRAQGVLF